MQTMNVIQAATRTATNLEGSKSAEAAGRWTAAELRAAERVIHQRSIETHREAEAHYREAVAGAAPGTAEFDYFCRKLNEHQIGILKAEARLAELKIQN